MKLSRDATNSESTNARQQDVNIDILNILWSRTIPFSYMILLILCEGIVFVFQKVLYDIGKWNQILVAMLLFKSQIYMLKTLQKGCSGPDSTKIEPLMIENILYSLTNWVYKLESTCTTIWLLKSTIPSIWTRYSRMCKLKQ